MVNNSPRKTSLVQQSQKSSNSCSKHLLDPKLTCCPTGHFSTGKGIGFSLVDRAAYALSTVLSQSAHGPPSKGNFLQPLLEGKHELVTQGLHGGG